MKVKIKLEVEADPKVLSIYVKCRDEFTARLMDADGTALRDYEGYVPSFMPGEHFGDYIILDIDIETGQVLNWEKPELEDLQRFIDGDNE